ncbi:MAG: RNA polymerase sigma factor [Omnitrophica WOR_2 bacterium]
MENESNLHAARQGNLEAFNQLVAENQDEIYNLAYLFLCDEAKAERATQATFLEAYLKRKEFRRSSFRIWLIRILVTQCQVEYTSRKSLATTLKQQKPDQLVPPGFKELNRDLRIVTALVHIQGLTIWQAAEVLNLPVEKIRNRQARALFEMMSSNPSLPAA